MMYARDRHELDAVPVCRKRKCYGIIPVFLIHKLRGKGNDLIYVRCAGIADLGAAHDDTLAGLAIDTDAVHIRIHDMEKLIRIRLLMRSLILLVTGALHVGLCAVADQIVLLHIFDIFL